MYIYPKWGGPGEVVFEELTDWARNADDRIRYYSGTAVYKKTITLDKLDKDEELVLRIPRLGAMAQVFINGKERYTYAYPEIVKAGDRLVPSGIIGEVLLVRR